MEQKKQNETQEKKQIMILAVLPGDDCDDTIRDLNEEGFFVTLLSSSGGFLKKKSTTVMIGAREEELEEILGIIKRNAGSRTETVYQAVSYRRSHRFRDGSEGNRKILILRLTSGCSFTRRTAKYAVPVFSGGMGCCVFFLLFSGKSP